MVISLEEFSLGYILRLVVDVEVRHVIGCYVAEKLVAIPDSVDIVVPHAILRRIVAGDLVTLETAEIVIHAHTLHKLVAAEMIVAVALFLCLFVLDRPVAAVEIAQRAGRICEHVVAVGGLHRHNIEILARSRSGQKANARAPRHYNVFYMLVHCYR